MVEIDLGWKADVTPPSDDATDYSDVCGMSYRVYTWKKCRCYSFILLRNETLNGDRYREFCPCCLKGRTRNFSGYGINRSISVFGSVRVNCAPCYDDFEKLDDQERLDVFKRWLWRVRYEEHLSSKAWQELRQQVIARQNGLCRCGSPGTDVHHLTYQRLGKEQLEDLELLCRACHQHEHGRNF